MIVKVNKIKDDIVSAFYSDQISYFEEQEAEKQQASSYLSKMILRFMNIIRAKLFHPCNISGMYFLRDFEDWILRIIKKISR